MKNDFMMAINQVCHERQLPIEVVLEAVEVALISAYKRNYSGHNSITAQIDQKSGEPLIFIEKAVVSEVRDKENEISLAEAQAIDRHAELDGLVSIESTPHNFGRIAAQTAKQVILQRIREAERDALYNTYAEREGEIINGTVHKIDPGQVTLSLGKVEALLPRSEQIPTERYTEGQRLRAFVSSVLKSSRGPQIIVSRTHRNMLRRLLEVEVPEIYNGTVEIKSIAREAGYRSKVAVAALQEGVDPVGSCVGMRGTRIQNIVNELNGEKIDVVQWNPDISFFIANSLSPAKVMNVMLHDERGKTAVVVVPDKQLSLAIGKEGQNARLAAKLTGWRIDIKSASEAATETLEKIKDNNAIRTRAADKPEIFNIVQAIVADKNPLDFSDSELRLIGEAIDIVNFAEMALRRERRTETTRPESLEIDILAEAEAILSGHKPARLSGLERIEMDNEDTLLAEALALVQSFDEEEVEKEPEELVAEEAVEPEPAAETPAEEQPAVAEAEPPEAVAEETPPAPTEEPLPASDEDTPENEEEDELTRLEREQNRKKARGKKRRLIYDEDLGEVVAERRRKPSRRSGWLNFGEEDE